MRLAPGIAEQGCLLLVLHLIVQEIVAQIRHRFPCRPSARLLTASMAALTLNVLCHTIPHELCRFELKDKSVRVYHALLGYILM